MIVTIAISAFHWPAKPGHTFTSFATIDRLMAR